MYLANLQDGTSVVVQPSEMESTLTIITEAGATATVSRVDSPNATEHTAGAANQFTVLESTRLTMTVDWPNYRISVAGGACRVGLAP